MTERRNTVEMLRAAWSAAADEKTELDETCAPQKTCRNAREFSFDGFAEGGTDLRTAWRERLSSEGKLSTSGETVRDLVLGSDDQH